MKHLKLHPADLGFIAIVAAYIAICWIIVTVIGHGDRFMPLMYLGTAGQITALFLLAYILYRLLRAAWIMIARRPAHLWQSLVDDLKQGPLRHELWRRGLPLFIAFIFFFSTFTSMKFLIADIKPFAWDEFFMKTDNALHFGTDPWRILQPVLGYPPVTFVIAFFYILWFPAFFLVLYWQLFRLKDDVLRMRFFYTFALTWAINGTFLAIYFSSAGPCYFENVTGSDYYRPLMDYLRSANEHYKIYSVMTQDMLWRNYMDKGVILGGGIAAFPSVHIGTVFLFVLLGWHISRLWFGIFLAFFFVIFAGSIHLGWHYAVDGYFSILTTWILWWTSGAISKRHCERSKAIQTV